MLSRRFPELSATCGQRGDGIPLGVVDDSLLTAAVLVAKIIPIQKVLREDVSATGRNYVDMTAAATDSAAGDFQPFGTLAAMSLEDSFYFHVPDGKECDTLHVSIATPGVGTYTIAIQEWDLAADAWVDMPITSDETNNFKSAAGVYKLKWTHTTKGSFKLLHTDAAKHVWHRIYIKTFTSASVAPVLSRLWAEDKVINHTDMTTYANSGDWTGFSPEFLASLDVYSMWIHPGLPIGAKVDVTTVASGTYTTVREYMASDHTWKPFPNFIDPSNDYRNLGSHRLTYNAPADWAKMTHQVTDAGATATGWFERRRINSISVQGPTNLHKTKTRSLALGPDTAGGLYHKAAKSYSGITFECNAAPATDMTLTFTAIGSDGSVSTQSVVWPTAVKNSWEVAGNYLAFATALVVPAGGQLMISHAGGGSVTDATISLVEG